MYIVFTLFSAFIVSLAIAKVLSVIFGYPFQLLTWSIFGFLIGILQISGAVQHNHFKQSDNIIKVKSFSELSDNFWGDLSDGFDNRLNNFDQYKWAWVLIILSAICSFILLPGIIIRNKTTIYSVLYMQFFINLFFIINFVMSSPKPNYLSVKVLIYLTTLICITIIPLILIKISNIE